MQNDEIIKIKLNNIYPKFNTISGKKLNKVKKIK
ncbi:hypothetical protein LCGC14_1495830 [marine sediment metagenome]|uniref:Uncharacterized protein n=1 Tax=marine sediment metagenome TaxID=412755 RepID=A0A0F9J5G6_9ZZZZ